MSRWPGPGHQSDPLHPAFKPRKPLWVSLAVGAIVLGGLIVYVLLA